MTDRPICACHGESMLRAGTSAAGLDRWRCRVKHRLANDRYRRTDKGRSMMRRARLHEAGLRRDERITRREGVMADDPFFAMIGEPTSATADIPGGLGWDTDADEARLHPRRNDPCSARGRSSGRVRSVIPQARSGEVVEA
jgi:hypothetical protein